MNKALRVPDYLGHILEAIERSKSKGSYDLVLGRVSNESSQPPCYIL
jgi:hypothetical protein